MSGKVSERVLFHKVIEISKDRNKLKIIIVVQLKR